MTYTKKRIAYNNNWPDKVIIFAGQQDFIKQLNESGIGNILKPIRLPLIEDFQFQRLLSFKIDIYEQLPNRPDIAFDFAWRTFEAYSAYFAREGSWSTTKTHKILIKICEDVLINQIARNQSINIAVSNLFKSVPLQATEFLVRRLFESAQNSIKPQQSQIIERVKDSIGLDLFEAIKEKYGNLTPDNQRKAGMLLQLLIGKERITLDRSYQLDTTQILKLIINGILYTYRNERFHGDAFSPFKSSKTQVKTYAHAYYCLIATYFFIAQLIVQHFPSRFDINEVSQSLENNTIRFNLVFSGQRKK